ncbi:MAG: UDP-N-acetylmuramoyl-tripeptide--D-alanyl-D-alanine ligase [Verrucomicrobiota bacterium]|nr:UDP-N-acetylmuramoyl-tripeptide--D-alanyl-D-alanine ligase [Verrucomicrobiota bacterium]
MQSFDPQHVAGWTGGSWFNEPKVAIEGFCFDARQIKPGQCFIALKTGARDGHEFLEQAVRGGAVAAIVENTKPVALPQLKVRDSLLALGAIGAAVRSKFLKPVVGITGSCGKTSTKEMLRCLLGEDRTLATSGNWNNRIGVPMTLSGLNSNQQDFAVIEAGINQPDEMVQLGRLIRADLNVLTNIEAAHLELLDSLENIASEKSLLAELAKPDSPIILHVDALRFHAYKKLAHRAIVLIPEGVAAPDLPIKKIVSYKVSHQMDNWGADQSMRVFKQVTIDGQNYSVASPSEGIATNTALAIVAAKYLGVVESDIHKRVEAWRPSGNRGCIETFGEQTFYIDCYNANPSSMADALDAFDRSTPQNIARFYILGAMDELGTTAPAQHEAIGNLLKLRPKDRVAFVGSKELTKAYASTISPEQCICIESVEKIKSTIAQFEGAIFLKGSRNYSLEKLLPSKNLNLSS